MTLAVSSAPAAPSRTSPPAGTRSTSANALSLFYKSPVVSGNVEFNAGIRVGSTLKGASEESGALQFLTH